MIGSKRILHAGVTSEGFVLPAAEAEFGCGEGSGPSKGFEAIKSSFGKH